MALDFKSNPEMSMTFFNSVFGQNHPAAVLAKQLSEKGVTFKVSLYMVVCEHPTLAKEVKMELTKGTTTLMNQPYMDPTIKLMQIKAILQGLEKLRLFLMAGEPMPVGYEEFKAQVTTGMLPKLPYIGPLMYPPEKLKMHWVLILDNHGPQLIQTVMALRVKLNIGLAVAKKIVDSTPCILMEGLSQDDTDKLGNLFDSVGAVYHTVPAGTLTGSEHNHTNWAHDEEIQTALQLYLGKTPSTFPTEKSSVSLPDAPAFFKGLSKVEGVEYTPITKDMSQIEQKILASMTPEQAEETLLNFKKAFPAVGDMHSALAKKQPVPSVIPLRDAEAVGQKVRGTNAASVYKVIALNDRVKLAVRITAGGGVSLRMETKNATASEIAAINCSGLQANSKANGEPYWSLHFDSTNVPAQRIVGAFLFDLGIVFDDQIRGGKELTVTA